MTSQKLRAETTRNLLLNAFRAAFLERGFEATTTGDVLQQTGLSKGALYHHFTSKTEILAAIYQAESHGAIERALRAVDAAASPVTRLQQACLAWMDAVRAPEVSQILFVIGPSALGYEKAKEIEDTLSLQMLETLLAEAVSVREIACEDLHLVAAIINAAAAEAALHYLRTAEDPVPTLKAVLGAVLDAFRPKPA